MQAQHPEDLKFKAKSRFQVACGDFGESVSFQALFFVLFFQISGDPKLRIDPWKSTEAVAEWSGVPRRHHRLTWKSRDGNWFLVGSGFPLALPLRKVPLPGWGMNSQLATSSNTFVWSQAGIPFFFASVPTKIPSSNQALAISSKLPRTTLIRRSEKSLQGSYARGVARGGGGLEDAPFCDGLSQVTAETSGRISTPAVKAMGQGWLPWGW